MTTNLTQKELAKMVGVSSGSISLLERGKSQLSEEKIEKIAEIFKCNVSDITIEHLDNYAAHVDADNCIYIPYKIFSFGLGSVAIYMYALLKKHMDPKDNITPYMSLTHITVISNNISSPSVIHAALKRLYTTNLITREACGLIYNWSFPQDPDCFVIPTNIISDNSDLTYRDIVIYMAIQSLIQNKKHFSYKEICCLCRVAPTTVQKCLKHLTRFGYCRHIKKNKYFCDLEEEVDE